MANFIFLPTAFNEFLKNHAVKNILHLFVIIALLCEFLRMYWRWLNYICSTSYKFETKIWKLECFSPFFGKWDFWNSLNMAVNSVSFIRFNFPKSILNIFLFSNFIAQWILITSSWKSFIKLVYIYIFYQ